MLAVSVNRRENDHSCKGIRPLVAGWCADRIRGAQVISELANDKSPFSVTSVSTWSIESEIQYGDDYYLVWT